MAEEKITSSIEIDVADAKANISALNREIKLLDSEFKATASGLGDWSASVEGNEAKVKQLTGTMEAQEEKIKNLNAQYADAVAKHGEHSAAAESLKIKINNEQAAFNANAAELEACNQRIAELTENSGDAGDAAGDLGDDVGDAADDIDDAGEATDGFSSKLKDGLVVAAEAAAVAVAAVAAAAAECIKAVYEWSTDVGESADEVMTLSSQTGISAEKLQAWGYAAQFVDTDVSTITGSMRKLTQQMGNAADGSDSASGKFEALGVSITNADGTLRSTEDVFWDAIDALGQIDNQAERDALAMDLFGKSATELNPLIEAGKDEWDAYCEEARELGVVLGEDELILAGGFNDAQNKFNSSITALKNSIGLEAIPAFQGLLETATSTVAGINAVFDDGFQPEDMVTIGEIIKEGLTSMTGQITDIMDTLSPVLTEILTGLIGVACELIPTLLPPLIEAAVNGLTTIAEKLPEIITTILESLAAVDWASLASSIVEGIFNAFISLISNADKILGAVWDLVKGIAEGLWNAITGIMPDWLKDLLGLGEEEPTITLRANLEGGEAEGIAQELLSAGVDFGDTDIYDIGDSVRDSLKQAVLDAYDIDPNELTDEWARTADMMFNAGNYTAEQYVDALCKAIENDDSDAGWEAIGRNADEGIAQGVKDNTDVIVSAVASAIGISLDEAKEILGIHSPSRVTRDLIGKNFGAGIAQGVADSVSGIESAVGAASAAAVGAMNSSVQSFSVTNNVNAAIRSEADIDLLAARLAARNKRIARGYAV